MSKQSSTAKAAYSFGQVIRKYREMAHVSQT